MQTGKIKNRVSIVIPVYNEGSNLEFLVNNIDEEIEKLSDKYIFEIIFVNDGSLDDTYCVIVDMAKSKKHVRLIDLSRNFGNQIAVTAGINESNGDMVITMDGDMQHPATLIPNLIREWEKGYEVVQAKRTLYKSTGFMKNILSSIYFYFINRISEVRIDREVSDFRLMDRKVVEYFNKIRERKRFVRGIINWMGFRKSYIEYQINPRHEGDTSFSILKLYRLAITSLTSFSLIPLKIASIVGTLITIISFGLLIFMGYTYIFVSQAMFRPIAFFAVLNALMGGVILVCLGFISMYIGDIIEEARNRPLYVIRERINFEEENGEAFLEEEKYQ